MLILLPIKKAALQVYKITFDKFVIPTKCKNKVKSFLQKIICKKKNRKFHEAAISLEEREENLHLTQISG